jgi:predicted Zn-dependent protease
VPPLGLERTASSFGNWARLRKWRKDFEGYDGQMDKLAGLKEILTMDPANAFARYGLAMEYVNRGEIATGLAEFDTLLAANPDYTAGYFMAAQTLAKEERVPEAIERLHAGIASARRTGNNHALSEMQGMLDELDR